MILAFLAAVAVPVQAAPRNEATPTALTSPLVDWIHDILAYFGFGPAPEAAPKEPEGPRAIFGKDDAGCDPNGTTCPESDTVQAPPLTEPTLPSNL